MAITVEKSLQNNQSILQNFALGEEIDAQAAEIISGGYENFTIRNTTGSNISYSLDGYDGIMQPGEEINFDSYDGGIIDFDMYAGSAYLQMNKSYNLSDGQIYEFQDNYDTSNAYDIDLYPVYS
ncbi:hypothetical protein [Anabaena sp. 90]|uniref:hypothetical protein n=1 Tax=Anabaena sp. 90 TaxID=46234 RepID=UPI0003140A9E|nr:hypothetical protein [Anabaena sp. 90]